MMQEIKIRTRVLQVEKREDGTYAKVFIVFEESSGISIRAFNEWVKVGELREGSCVMAIANMEIPRGK